MAPIHSTCLFYPLLNRQESSFRAELDTPLIRIGEQLNLTWELRSPAQNEIAWPSWNDTLKGIELLQSSAIDTSYDEENIAIRILRQTHQITSFDSGYYAIPPVYAVVNDSILGSNALLLSVQNVQLDSALVCETSKADGSRLRFLGLVEDLLAMGTSKCFRPDSHRPSHLLYFKEKR